MRLTVVGCSGSYPGPDSPASCYLVEADREGRTYRILLDLGNGAFGYLQRFVDPLAIDAAFLSHLHADHCLDFTAYYVLRKYDHDAPFPPLPVWGPAGTAERLASAYDIAPRPGMSAEFSFREFTAEPVRIGPMTIETVRVDHPVEAYAIRVGDGATSLVYSGDTARCDALATFATGADLLLAEASFVESETNPPGVHMTGREAAATASEAGVAALVLTHIPPWHARDEVLADARSAFIGPLLLATVGDIYEVGGVQ